MAIVTDVLVIGGGQAGLATGYHLARSAINYIIVDGCSRIGDSWRNRYDSLMLFTPKAYSELPGMHFPGDREQIPSKDETVDYLEAYAHTFKLNIQLNSSVTSVTKYDGQFHISTSNNDYIAKQVVIATGPFQSPWKPEFASNVSKEVNQIHSSNYKNPDQLIKGDTLVVGAGNSGAQIAVEISKQRNVYLSAGHRPFSLPMRIGGKNIFYWFDKLGILRATSNTFIGQKLKNRPDPVFGFELKRQLKSSAITLLPKAVDADEHHIHFLDGSHRQFTNIIWSTGFKPDYNWLTLPHVLQTNGAIIHQRGITTEEGLFVVGMPWQHRRTSALLCGVGEDAEYVVAAITRSLKIEQ